MKKNNSQSLNVLEWCKSSVRQRLYLIIIQRPKQRTNNMYITQQVNEENQSTKKVRLLNKTKCHQIYGTVNDIAI